MNNENESKVVILKEKDTRLLKEELEDFIIKANMILQNKNFEEVESVLEVGKDLLKKFNEVKEKLNNFEDNVEDTLIALQASIGRLQSVADAAEELKTQHLQIKLQIEELVNNHFLNLKKTLKSLILPFFASAIKETKKELKEKINEFNEEINEAIDKAKDAFGFFEKEEIMYVLKEIDLRRKKANVMFYTAIFLFVISIVVSIVTYFSVQKVLDYTKYNAYTLHQIVQPSNNNTDNNN